ncbi:hypothetical protein Scep_024599 [Stephania cephalantha]|uniref:Uncharacterized protein n=1 Tax=Stephania cephalantha TaxID=152367 RepID=A0AAP0F5U8_9MAGN
MHNVPSSFQASHHSSHADTPSRHDTPLYTPSVPFNEFVTPHTPSVPPTMTFEAMEAFPFDTAPTSSRHFHASPIMMNLSGSTSTQDGGMRDNDDIQPRRCSKSTDVGHSDIPLARNVMSESSREHGWDSEVIIWGRLGLFLYCYKSFPLYSFLSCS